MVPPTNVTVGVSNSATLQRGDQPHQRGFLSMAVQRRGHRRGNLVFLHGQRRADCAPGSYSYSVIANGEGLTITSPPGGADRVGAADHQQILPGTNVTVNLGSNVTLSVSASDSAGVSFYYQWQRNGQFILWRDQHLLHHQQRPAIGFGQLPGAGGQRRGLAGKPDVHRGGELWRRAAHYDQRHFRQQPGHRPDQWPGGRKQYRVPQPAAN